MQKPLAYQIFFDLLIVCLLVYQFLIPSMALSASFFDLAIGAGFKLLVTIALCVILYKKNPSEYRSLMKKNARGIFDAAFSWLFLIFIYFSITEFFKLRVADSGLSPLNPLLQVSIFLYFGIVGPVFEEVFFRGVLVDRLKVLFKSEVWAYLVSTMAFAALHLSTGIFGLILALLAGTLFALLRNRHKSLIPPIIAHCLYNSLLIILYIL